MVHFRHPNSTLLIVRLHLRDIHTLFLSKLLSWLDESSAHVCVICIMKFSAKLFSRRFRSGEINVRGGRESFPELYTFSLFRVVLRLSCIVIAFSFEDDETR